MSWLRVSYLQRLLQKAEGSTCRCFSTQAGQALERWLQSWDLSTPPVSFLPGTDPPTALSWLRRRGPALPDALLNKLFRQEIVRVYDPASGLISRARKTRGLPPGVQLLLPKALLAEAQQVQRAAGRKAPEPPSPEQQRLRLRWIRELRRRVLYQDADLIAVDKPAGLAVQGGSGVTVSVDEIMGSAFSRLVPDPSQLRLVHRLDQQTTGVLVIATSPDSAAWLSQGFRGGNVAAAARGSPGGPSPGAASAPGVEIRKTYWGVVAKHLPRDVVAGWDTTAAELPARGEIDLPIAVEGRRSGRESSSVDSPDGSSSRGGGQRGREGRAAALTLFTLRQQNEKLAWLELRPLTGRKHQLRIHCASGLRTPILGDSKYGAVRSQVQQEVLMQLRDEGAWAGDTPPMFLHCRSILIKKPGVREAIRLVAPPHPHWQVLLQLQRWGGGQSGPEQGAQPRRQPSLKR